MPRKTLAQRGAATTVVVGPTEAECRAVALVNLSRARRQYEVAQRAVAENVREAHELGATWADIGDVLRMSRQGARQRFSVGNRSEAEGGSPDAEAARAGGRR